MFRYASVVLAAAVLIGASFADGALARGRGGGGGFRGGGGGFHGGGMRAGGFHGGGRAHVSHPIAGRGRVAAGGVYRGGAYRGYRGVGVGAAAVGVGAAAAAAGAYGYSNYGCYYDSYGSRVCPGQYPYGY